MRESERLRKKCLRLSSWVSKRYKENPLFATKRIMIIWEFYAEKIKIAKAVEDVLDHAAKMAGGMAKMEAKMRRVDHDHV